jgi:hypothetical protein
MTGSNVVVRAADATGLAFGGQTISAAVRFQHAV